MKSLIRAAIKRLDLARGPMMDNGRRGALHRAWGLVGTNQIKGHYYEFGVYRGASLVESYRQYLGLRAWIDAELKSPEPWRRDVAMQYAGWSPRFFGFDTYAGMPENEEGDPAFAGGTFMTDIASVSTLCRSEGLVEPQLALMKGLFSDFSPDALPGPAVIVNLDADLYQSSRDALFLVKHVFQQGSILLADDYNCFSARSSAGQRRAMNEFTQETQIQFEPWFAYQFAGMAFIVHTP